MVVGKILVSEQCVNVRRAASDDAKVRSVHSATTLQGRERACLVAAREMGDRSWK